MDMQCRQCGIIISAVRERAIVRGYAFCSKSCSITYQYRNIAENVVTRYWSKVNVAQPSECWEWKACANWAGYGRFGIHRSHTLAHRMVIMLTQGPILPDMSVCHHCDNPLCCNPAHLFVGTRSDNLKDASRKGRLIQQTHPERMPHGEAIGTSKLKDFQVLEIRELHRNGMAHKEIAAIYDISRRTVNDVANGRTWKILEEADNDG